MLAVAGLTGGLLLTSPQSASAANLIKNPGFETAGTDDMPYCWKKSGWGDNDFARYFLNSLLVATVTTVSTMAPRESLIR